MQFRELATDDDAVSPVIGVILMVAITVILAAVIGAFVLGFGGGGPSAPSVTWDSSDNSSGYVIFEHDGGDTIDSPDEVLGISGNSLDDDGSASSSPMTTGAEFAAQENNSSSPASGEYTLVWSPEDGDSSQELATHNV